jgi:hypothetical protein
MEELDMYRCSVFVMTALLLQVTSFGQSLGAATEAGTAAVLLQEEAGLVASADGSWLLALTTSGGAVDVVSTTLDDRGQPIAIQDFSFPGNLDASPVNRGLAMAKSGRFAVCYGSNSANDLILLRRDLNGAMQGFGIDFPGGLVPALDSVPVIPDDERFVVALGPGGSQDLFIVPIGTDANGLATPGIPIPIAFANNGSYPFLSGIRPTVTRNGNAIVIPGISASQDLQVVTVPANLAIASPSAAAVAYPNNNFVADPAATIAVSPDSRWVATLGSPTTGDVVVTPLSPTGVAGTPENVLLPANNNAASNSEPLLVSPNGRVIALRGTLINGDLAMVPVDDTGDAGTAINVSFTLSNFIPSGSPPPFMSPNGRFVGSAGSATIGDLVITEFNYDAALNSVSATPRNVLFPNQENRRNGADFSVSEDGAVIATYGADTNQADLIVVTVDPFGSSGGVFTIPFPSFNNASPDSLRPVVDPGATWVAAPGNATIGDLVLVNLVRDPNCVLVPGTIETRLLAFNNNFDLNPVDLRLSPNRQYIYGLGSDPAGDLAFVPFDDARVYPLAPACLGQALPLRFRAPDDPFANYQAAVAFGRCPGISVDVNRRVDLVDDLLFRLSITPMDPAFFGFSGQLGPNGNAFGAMFLPLVPEARGIPLHFAFVVLDPFDPSGVGTISRSTSVTLR